jgi:hypothetical protein
MSVEERLRTGLGEYAASLLGDVDLDVETQLSAVVSRAALRSRRRRAGFGVLTLAVGVVLAWMWFGAATGHHDAEEVSPPGPIATDLHARVTALDPTFFTHGLLSPGVYAHQMIAADASRLPWAVVDVPRGYRSDGGALVVGCPVSPTDQLACGPDSLTLSFWQVDHVNTDPCLGFDYRDPGPSTADLAQALADQPLRGPGKPRPAVLGGHPGWSLVLTAPDRLDQCREDDLAIWKTGQTQHHNHVAGQVDRLWIVEVDGERLVVDASYGPRAPRAKVDELLRMARGVTFEDPPQLP